MCQRGIRQPAINESGNVRSVRQTPAAFYRSLRPWSVSPMKILEVNATLLTFRPARPTPGYGRFLTAPASSRSPCSAREVVTPVRSNNLPAVLLSPHRAADDDGNATVLAPQRRLLRPLSGGVRHERRPETLPAPKNSVMMSMACSVLTLRGLSANSTSLESAQCRSRTSSSC